MLRGVSRETPSGSSSVWCFERRSLDASKEPMLLELQIIRASEFLRVGARGDLSRRWSLEAKGTVGGFGVASDIAWEAFCGASYRFNDCCSLTFGYRYLHEEYSRGGFALDLDTHGFLLGVGFHF